MVEYIKQHPQIIPYIMTGIGQIASWSYDVLQRDMDSKKSPKKFSLWFYVKDNKIQLPFSAVLAFVISFGLDLGGVDYVIGSAANDTILTVMTSVLYISVGMSPGLFFTWLKRTSKAKFLRPDVVKVDGKEYKRK